MTTANRTETSPGDRPVAAPGGPSSWVLDPVGTTAAFSNKSMWGLVTVRGTFPLRSVGAS